LLNLFLKHSILNRHGLVVIKTPLFFPYYRGKIKIDKWNPSTLSPVIGEN